MKSFRLACLAVLALLCAAGVAHAGPSSGPAQGSAVDGKAGDRKSAARKKAAAKRRKARLERKLRRDLPSSVGRIDDVVDGDTLIVKTTGKVRETFTVQVLGIDPPGTTLDGDPEECGGQQATAFMLALGFARTSDSDGDGLVDGTSGRSVPVRLSTDPRQPVYQRGSGNLLAYLDVAAGARAPGSAAYDMGKTMIASGYARARSSKLTRGNAYLGAEAAAKQARSGVWTQCAGNFHAPLGPG